MGRGEASLVFANHAGGEEVQLMTHMNQLLSCFAVYTTAAAYCILKKRTEMEEGTEVITRSQRGGDHSAVTR